MVHLHKKKLGKNKRPYWYARKTQWVDGESKVVWQMYLGSAEKIMKCMKQCKKTQIEVINQRWEKVINQSQYQTI